MTFATFLSNIPTLPPIGVPTTKEISQCFHTWFPLKPALLTHGDLTTLTDISRQQKDNAHDPLWAKGAQVAFVIFRLMELHPKGTQICAWTHFGFAILDFGHNDPIKGFASLARGIASMMGFGGYLFFADIAVVVTKEIDLGNQSLWK